MKIIYDPNTDTMTIILKESAVAESDEEKKESSSTTITRETWSPLR